MELNWFQTLCEKKGNCVQRTGCHGWPVYAPVRGIIPGPDHDKWKM